jgi:hypothetical protein
LIPRSSGSNTTGAAHLDDAQRSKKGKQRQKHDSNSSKFHLVLPVFIYQFHPVVAVPSRSTTAKKVTYWMELTCYSHVTHSSC